jgi:hypothetical protein
MPFSQQDVLMRQIRQLGQALARIVRQASDEDPGAVAEAVDEACATHLGASSADLHSVPPERLLAMCEVGGSFSAEAAQTLSKVLKVQGDAYSSRGALEKAGACYGRALLLLRRALNAPGAAVSWQIGTQVAALESDVDEHPPASDALARALEETR